MEVERKTWNTNCVGKLAPPPCPGNLRVATIEGENRTKQGKTIYGFGLVNLGTHKTSQNYLSMQCNYYDHHTSDTSKFLRAPHLLIQQKPTLLDQEAAATASAPAVLGRCALFLRGKNKNWGQVCECDHLWKARVFFRWFPFSTLRETNRSSLKKIGAWETILSFWEPQALSFREGKPTPRQGPRSP